jgi:hypothetical protein
MRVLPGMRSLVDTKGTSNTGSIRSLALMITRNKSVKLLRVGFSIFKAKSF